MKQRREVAAKERKEHKKETIKIFLRDGGTGYAMAFRYLKCDVCLSSELRYFASFLQTLACRSILEISSVRCNCLHCTPTLTKNESVTLRLTEPEKADLEAAAILSGHPPGTLAALYVKEGVKRSRFPIIDFRDGAPGRIAYITGTRWPVWMVVDLVRDLGGNTREAAKRVEKPEAIVKMALAYADAYPGEIAASLALHAHRDFDNLKITSPNLEKL